MPKISRDRKVIVKEEPLGLYHCILLQPLHKYKVPSLRCNRLYAPPVVVTPRPFDPERARKNQEAIEQLRQRHYKWVANQKATTSIPLIDRISEPYQPLIERLQAPAQLEECKPLPSNLRFRKTKILYRIQEFSKLFEPTVKRLIPFVEKALSDDRIPSNAKEKVRVWGREFNELWVNLEKRAEKLMNKEWRIIKKHLKAISQISFKNLCQRLPEICEEINVLNLSFNYGTLA
ncbi:hypothetical protein GY45DRAFT_603216 [Cubamyces sp. BRFM 1775]|nr:hypothetical protein GY45DRAFT_603216 [Cubamyces sp. BRFM 1775]